MTRLVKILLVVLVVGYFGICGALYVFQRSLIYHPVPRLTPDSTTIVTLEVGGEKVLVSARPHDGPKAIIYFGGNSEDVSARMPAFSEAFPDHAIYLMHFRGYGGSSGKPTEEGLVADSLALFDKVRTDHPEITVIGHSLGSGVAVHLASLRPASRLILVTPYDSLVEIAARRFPIFPVSLIMTDKFESWRYAPAVTVPTLIIAAENDEVIPRENTDRLFTRFADGVATFKVIANTDHNSISRSPEYLRLLRTRL
ncbi:alpha/beta hydrolase [soil metagenome]